jgi:hypothetical protein
MVVIDRLRVRICAELVTLMLGHEHIYICIMSAWVVQLDAGDVYEGRLYVYARRLCMYLLGWSMMGNCGWQYM